MKISAHSWTNPTSCSFVPFVEVPPPPQGGGPRVSPSAQTGTWTLRKPVANPNSSKREQKTAQKTNNSTLVRRYRTAHHTAHPSRPPNTKQPEMSANDLNNQISPLSTRERGRGEGVTSSGQQKITEEANLPNAIALFLYPVQVYNPGLDTHNGPTLAGSISGTTWRRHER